MSLTCNLRIMAVPRLWYIPDTTRVPPVSDIFAMFPGDEPGCKFIRSGESARLQGRAMSRGNVKALSDHENGKTGNHAFQTRTIRTGIDSEPLSSRISTALRVLPSWGFITRWSTSKPVAGIRPAGAAMQEESRRVGSSDVPLLLAGAGPLRSRVDSVFRNEGCVF